MPSWFTSLDPVLVKIVAYAMQLIRPCSVAGCRSAVTSRYVRICSGHRKAQARHGDVGQVALKVAEFAPFLKLIKRRQADNADSAAWAILRKRWLSLVAKAHAFVAETKTGKPFNRFELEAAQRVLTLAEGAEPDLVVQTALASCMHRVENPGRYASDRAALFQLARKVLRLAPGSISYHYNKKTDKMKTVQRDTAPKVLLLIGQSLNEAFGGAAFQLANIERDREPPEEQERRQLAEALDGLKA